MGRFLESSKVRGGGSNTVLVNKNKKTVTLNKVNENDEPIEGVNFSVFYYEKDAKENKNVIESKNTDSNGKVTFTLPDYYGVFIKETKVPKGYKISDEIIHVYKDNGVRFIGEKKVEDFKVAGAKNWQNLNNYLQRLLPDPYNYDYTIKKRNFRDQIDWLIFNDNGVEKLIPKKSLKYSVSWENINNADLADGSKTVTIDGKTYKIRLMNDYNNNIKGSEWNRMILPLIKFGRFGSKTQGYVEQNMPILANYSWWTDFRGNTRISVFDDDYYGTRRWTNTSNYFADRTVRGDAYTEKGAAHMSNERAYRSDTSYGWLPVLEEVK